MAMLYGSENEEETVEPEVLEVQEETVNLEESVILPTEENDDLQEKVSKRKKSKSTNNVRRVLNYQFNGKYLLLGDDDELYTIDAAYWPVGAGVLDSSETAVTPLSERLYTAFTREIANLSHYIDLCKENR